MVLKDEKLIEEVLTRGIEQIYPTSEAFKKALMSGKKLRIYAGFDPTSSHLHFGHAEQILLLRRLMRLGHEVIFLIGDFTARIGDPTDKAAARVPLSKKEIKKNLKTFKEQAGRIIKFGGFFGGGAKVKFNSSWLSGLDFSKLIKLAQNFTVQQMIERDMFQERLKAQKPIGLHEFFYPLMQGYDSVAMNVDAEVGGSDQTFNMLAGRHLEKIYNNKEKFVIATKLMANPKTGKKLMSKTEGTVINLDDTPTDIFGKTMALEDDSMFVFAELSTEMSIPEIHKMGKEVLSGTLNPRDAKLEIAEAAVALVYGSEAAKKAKGEFIEIFSEKKLIANSEFYFKKPMEAVEIAKEILNSSGSEARRLIEQGALEINGKKVTDLKEVVELKQGDIIRVGKKHVAEAMAK